MLHTPTYRILITDEISPQALEHLEAARDVNFDVVKSPPREEFLRIVGDYDGIVIRSSVRIDAGIIEAGRKLRVIGRAGVGLDNVDIEAASLSGIVVMNTPGANTIATAEHTITMMMALCRKLTRAHNSVRRGEWNRKEFIGVQLHKMTLGIIGLGRVGREVARRARAFGMEVIASDPYISADVAREMKVIMVNIDELLARSDFITLHNTLTDETRGMVGAEQIDGMKKGVYFINCARGGIVDEDALIEGLKSGHIAGAALDVYAKEPLPPDSPLLEK